MLSQNKTTPHTLFMMEIILGNVTLTSHRLPALTIDRDRRVIIE